MSTVGGARVRIEPASRARRRSIASLAVVLVLTPLIAPLTAPGTVAVDLSGLRVLPGWTNVSTGFGEDTPPEPLSYAGGAYFPDYSSWVVFGGENRTGPTMAPGNTTWLYVTGEGEWDPLGEFVNSTAPPSPPPLLSPELGYDPLRHAVVLTGGTLPNGSLSPATWTLSGPSWNSLRWQPVPSALAPPGAPGSSLATDPVLGQIVLYDGANGSLWTDASSGWSLLSLGPSGTASAPPTRTGAASVGDPQRNGTVLYGGRSDGPAGALRNDSWLYSGGRWTPLPPGPPPLQDAEMVYDDARSAVVLVGLGPASMETWELNATGWVNRTGPGPSIEPARSAFALAYDPIDSTALLFGGALPVTDRPVADLWAWYLPVPTTDQRLSSVPIPVLEALGLIAAGLVPVVLAVLYYRRPPRPSPVRVPVGSPARG